MKSIFGMIIAALLFLPLSASAHTGNIGTKIESKKVTSMVSANDKAPASSKEVNHSGRTNKDGCHHDRKNGGYHCH